MAGRLDAARAEEAETYIEKYPESKVLDLSQLDYVSSAGLGVFLKMHKRLAEQGSGLKLVQVNGHILDIFKYSGFDKLFDIEAAE